MDAFFKLVAAGPLFFVSACHPAVFAGDAAGATGVPSRDRPGVRARLDADPRFGYEITRRFLAVAANRLQATRFRLLDPVRTVTDVI